MQQTYANTIRWRRATMTLCAVAALAASWGYVARPGAAADDTVTASGDELSKDETDARFGKRAGRYPMPSFTPEREAAAVTFVSAHHPELAPLLAGLKISRPSEYQKAIRKLFGDSERLAHSHEMQPRRYELELQEWKLESRAQLLIAKLSMGRTAELEAQLRKVLNEQMHVQRELLNQERERLAQRTAAVDKEIAKLDDDREAKLEDRLQKALKSAGQKRPAAKTTKSDVKSPDVETP